MRDVFLPGAGSQKKNSPAFLKFTELLKENHLLKSQPLMRDSRLLSATLLQSTCRSECLT
jgi:hypothetical protein